MVNKVLFLGSKRLGFSVLNTIFSLNKKVLTNIITFDDSADKRSYLKHYKDFSTVNNVPIDVLKGPKGLKNIITKIKPELVLVVGWYWIIPNSILQMVRCGFVGIHGSLLPRYRGFAPFVWALINGEDRTGVSLFYLSNGIDTGDIVAQKEFIIHKTDTINDVLTIAEKKTIELISENFIDLIEEKNKRIPQSTNNISYCSIRKPEDGLIDFYDSNVNVYNFIRAQSDPYPGAYSYINNQKYFILEAKIVEDQYYGVPGVIASKGENSITVCCKKGAINVTKICREFSKTNIVGELKFGIKFKEK